MRIVDDGIALGAGERGGVLQCLGGLNGETIGLNHGCPSLGQWVAPGLGNQRAAEAGQNDRGTVGAAAKTTAARVLPPHAAVLIAAAVSRRPYFIMIIFFVKRRPSTTS